MKNLETSRIENRLSKINVELVHDGYLDGWTILALKEEKRKLELELAMILSQTLEGANKI